MGELLTTGIELRLPAADALTLVADLEVQRRWLGEGCSLPRETGRVGALVVGGTTRHLQRLSDGTYRVDTGEVATTLQVTVTALDGSRPRCRVEVAERVVTGSPTPEVVAGWEAWWTDALGRLRQVAETVRRRRVPVQAVVVIHGIGEQLPGDTLRAFVEAATDPQRRAPLHSKPDHISTSYELRRMGMAASGAYPKTDFFELYWAHHIRDTTTPQVVWWLARLLTHPKRMRPALRRLWGAVLVAALLLAALGFVVADVATGLPAGVQAALALVVIPLLAVGASWVVLRVLGDAPRYLSPAPANVDVRERIRGQGVRLLLDLHRSNRYDRIVVVGHSLGSVIAYDMISIVWGILHLDHQRPVSPPRKRAAGVNGYTGDDADQAHSLQHQAWEETRRATQPWLITDLVTVGSPLAHAELLLARPGREIAELAGERRLPTCPPVRDEKSGTGSSGNPAPPVFSRNAAYIDRNGASGNFVFFHNAAPFAVTRWTNIYVPIRALALGDPVGGPLRPLFGGWIRDVQVTSPHGLAHTKYWRLGDGGTPTEAVVALRRALRLEQRRDLERLLADIPAYALVDPRAYGAKRLGADVED